MGKPLSILAKINNMETPICLDTGAGANAINTNYLKKLGINPIATKIFEKPIAIEVGNSQTTSVTETVLLQLHTKEHVSYVRFLKIDELPIKAILGYTSATILNITMQSGGEIYWDKEHIPKTDIPMGIYYSTVSSADKKQAIQELYPTKRTIIPARSKKEVSVSTKDTPQSYFLTIDLTDTFWSILVKDSDIEKTAFTSASGLWEFISMPFGLTNAPATQQRFIEAVLNGLIWQCCFAYIDDILCYSPTFENHLQDLKEIFIRFQENRLKIQPPKCKFCHLTFDILGFVAT